jgi:hypothetical protein
MKAAWALNVASTDLANLPFLNIAISERRYLASSRQPEPFRPFDPLDDPRSTAAGSFVVGGPLPSTCPVAMSITSLAA